MDITTTSPWIEIASEPLAAGATEASAECMLDEGDNGLLQYDCTDLLREAGLRPTRQRLMLGEFLFSNGGRHVTADMIYTQAAAANMPISRATVYNTLNQFTEAGLLRQIGVDGSSRSSIRTRPPTIISSSITKTGCWTFPNPASRSNSCCSLCRATRSQASTSSSICAGSRDDAPFERRIRDAVGIATIRTNSKSDVITNSYEEKTDGTAVAVHGLRGPTSAPLKLPLW